MNRIRSSLATLTLLAGANAVAAQAPAPAGCTYATGDLSPTGATAAVGAVGFSIASAVYAIRAAKELSRGIWWYNAALPR